jgi:two-component system cell cycle response regulator
VCARILVIEDNPTNMDLMTYLLKSFGHEVLTHEDGREVVELVRNERPDLIICDIELPGADGYLIVRQLKADGVLARIPLIAVTASAMVGDRARVFAAGFDGYIGKPIEPSRFVSQIQDFLRPEQRREYPDLPATESYPDSVELPAIRGKVLVVDDVPGNLSLMRALLVPSGYEVHTAEDVTQAWTVVRQFTPDLIITDVHMPSRSGYEFARMLREDPELCSIPCILVSSTSLDLEMRNSAADVGAELFILRPIDSRQLLAEIERRIIIRTA